MRIVYQTAGDVAIRYPIPRVQLVAVHAPLREVEWPATIEHIEATSPTGLPLLFAPVASGKSLLDRVKERGMFPGVCQ